MRVIDAGHLYELEDTDADESTVQRIQFVRRRDGRGEPLHEASREGGILTQELLRVAIDRTLYLYAEAPCDEDTQIINKLRECLVLYEARAARRTIKKLSKPEEANICGQCHHILCLHGRER